MPSYILISSTFVWGLGWLIMCSKPLITWDVLNPTKSHSSWNDFSFPTRVWFFSMSPNEWSNWSTYWLHLNEETYAGIDLYIVDTDDSLRPISSRILTYFAPDTNQSMLTAIRSRFRREKKTYKQLRLAYCMPSNHVTQPVTQKSLSCNDRIAIVIRVSMTTQKIEGQYCLSNTNSSEMNVHIDYVCNVEIDRIAVDKDVE